MTKRRRSRTTGKPLSPEDAAVDSDASGEPDGTYQVGYGKPPHHSRFKPGQSGNPKGRPKKSKNLSTIVRDAAMERVRVSTPQGERKMSRFEAIVRGELNRAAKGDPKAVTNVCRIMREFGLIERVDDEPNAPSMVELNETDREILGRLSLDLTADPDTQDDCDGG